ncbi:MAG: hypothetical protein WCK03_02430 [Candidatus Taylorbacteria bacterium]
MQTIIIFLDILIILLSFVVLKNLLGYGGNVGKSLTMIGVGIFVVGLSQIVETLGINFSLGSTPSIELVHRLFIFSGLLFEAWGYYTLMKKR